QMIIVAVTEALEAFDRIGQVDEYAGRTGEDLGDEERLRQEALDFTGTGHGELIFFRQLVHTKNRDDVLKRLVALQNGLDATGHLVVLLADDARIEHARRGVERVHGRIDALFRDGAREHGRSVKVRERGSRRWVSQVVGRD